jgi:hypothetical protein
MDSIGAMLHSQHKEVEAKEDRKTCPIAGGVCNEAACNIWNAGKRTCGILSIPLELADIFTVLSEIETTNRRRIR